MALASVVREVQTLKYLPKARIRLQKELGMIPPDPASLGLPLLAPFTLCLAHCLAGHCHITACKFDSLSKVVSLKITNTKIGISPDIIRNAQKISYCEAET